MSDPSLLGLPAYFEYDPSGSGAPRRYPFAGSAGGRDRPFEVKARFVLWLQGEAYKVVRQHAALLGPSEAEARKAAWHRDCASKVYAWNSERCRQALYSEEGLKQMAWLQFSFGEGQAAGRGEPSQFPMSPELLEKVFEDPAKAEELARLVWEPLAEEGDPNPPAPGATPSADSTSTPSAPS